jgi:hypothetical protein
MSARSTVRQGNRSRSAQVMHVVSVNVGLPRRVRWKGRDVTTGIFKVPVEGRVALHRLNFQGDDIATIKRLVALDALPEDWRSYFAKRLPAVSSTTAK